MRKVICFLLIFVTIFFFNSKSSAETKVETQNNFYLQTRTTPQKLIPSILQLDIAVGESADIKVDSIPIEADMTKLVWELVSISEVADITWKGNFCTIHAKNTGSGVINVSDSDGAAASIKFTVSEALPATLSLEVPASSILTGDSVLIRASTTPNNTQIMWSVQGEEHAILSYGGALCRIKGINPGEVTVRAAIKGTDIAQEITLNIKNQPTKKYSYNNLLLILIYGGISLLLLSFVLWLQMRKGKNYEKKI